MEEEFDNQGKRPDQVEKSGKILMYSIVAMIIFVVLNCIFKIL